METIENPLQIVWNESDLPDVSSVPRDCSALVWIVDEKDKLLMITVAMPWADNLNPLRWCDSSRYPLAGYYSLRSKIKYWSWIRI